MTTSRNLRARLGLDLADTVRLGELMNEFIEYALIDVDPADIATAGGVEMDAADRHVLAAALTADADVLLTQNTRHFPRGWMSDRGIELLSSGDLLVRLAEQFPDKICAAHTRTLQFSPKSEEELLATLERSAGPAAAEAIRRACKA